MSPLTPDRAEALQDLLASVSDEMLTTLDDALSVSVLDSDAGAAAAARARAERREREVRDSIFAPLTPLRKGSAGGADPSSAARPTCDAVPDLWRLLRRTDREAVEAAVAAALDPDGSLLDIASADALTRLAAARLGGHEDWAPLREQLSAQDPEGVERLGSLLQLSPTIRRVSRRARELTHTGAGDHVAAVRLAFRDAEAAAPGGGVLLLSALAAQLDTPWKALRLVSAVMGKPSDAYLAQSELAGFGLALLDDIDARLAALRTFDGGDGVAAGEAAGASALSCAQQLVELDQCLNVSREGDWGRRMAQQRRELGRVGEQRLKDAVLTIDRALPVSAARLKGKVRGMPRLDLPLDPATAQRALGLLAFMRATRTAAGASGFASARARAIEELDARLDHYVEDVLELLHAGESEADAEDLKARLEFAAQCLAVVREPRAGELIRRRAAAA